MKEYKIMEAKNKDQAQQVMNTMAQEGWDVVGMTYWNNWKLCLLITFSRESTAAETVTSAEPTEDPEKASAETQA